MSDLSRTAITPICRKCGVELGQSYVYSTDGFIYHHMCYPVSPKEVRILELERDLAAAQAGLAKSEADNARLAIALKFYADVSKYPAPLTGGMGDLWADCGQIARDALFPTPSE